MSLSWGREICGTLATAESREWLCTNGIDGFASGTVAGMLTRRHHGLLIAALKPPLGRTLLVAKLDGRPEVAKRILTTFSRFVDQGMLPNRFPDAGETPEYNTVELPCGISKRSAHTTRPPAMMGSFMTSVPCWERSSAGIGKAPGTGLPWTRGTASFVPENRASNSPGWMPKWETGWSPRGPARR